MRYFISYNKLVGNNNLMNKIEFSNANMYIMKEQDDSSVKFYSAKEFIVDDNVMNIREFTDMLMVEVLPNDIDKVEEKDLEKFVENSNKAYEKTYFKYETNNISLINYNALAGMTPYDMELGKIVALKVDESGNFYITDRITSSRKSLQNNAIGSDLYFYTENEDLLDKFSDSIIELKNKGINKYVLSKHKIAVIDSISQNRVYDFTTNTYLRFRELCDSSTKISIDRVDDKYKLSILDHIGSREKKGYIISNSNFSNMLYDPSMEILLDYINIYELEDGYYIKKPILDYLGNHVGVKSYKNRNYKRIDKRAA